MNMSDTSAGDDSLLLLLGRGAFSSVDCVFRKKTREIAARKVYDRARSIEAGRAQRIMQEKRALGALKSPYICRLLGTEKDDSSLYLYLEPVFGGTLSAFLQSYGCMANIDDIRVVAIQLMSALRHMKAAGCLHRDIKCNNIVLSANFRCIKLCDFSSAKVLDSNDGRDSLGSLRTYTLIGTPEFMAPEMLLRCGYSFEIDVWAMGVVLFELCTGNRPFTDQARDWVERNGSTAVRSTFSDATSASALQLGEPARDDISNDKIANFFHTHCGIDFFELDVFCTTDSGRQLAEFISTHLITSDRSFRDINTICQKALQIQFLAPFADTNWEYFTEVEGPHLSDDVYIDTETAELVECLSKKYLIS